MLEPIKTIIFLIFYAFLSTVGLTILKKSLNHVDGSTSFINIISDAFLGNMMFWGGFVLYVIGFVFWILALRLNSMTTVFPIAMGMFFLFITLSGVFVLNEKVTILNMIGILLIFIGGVAVSI